MKADQPKAANVDEYIGAFPKEVKERLQAMRKAIKSAAPKAEESISYNMPGYKYKGVLVYFGAYKNHIGFYPTSLGITAFKEELADYEISKGTMRFPHDKPFPIKIITQIVKFRVQENEEKLKEKPKKK